MHSIVQHSISEGEDGLMKCEPGITNGNSEKINNDLFKKNFKRCYLFEGVTERWRERDLSFTRSLAKWPQSEAPSWSLT